jgi:hypothetical protein
MKIINVIKRKGWRRTEDKNKNRKQFKEYHLWMSESGKSGTDFSGCFRENWMKRRQKKH